MVPAFMRVWFNLGIPVASARDIASPGADTGIARILLGVEAMPK